jgi:nucleotide-binding universal stress UspA family protein
VEFAALKHILVATDGSELASKAVSEGLRLASILRAQVTFLTVTSPFASLGDHDAAFAQLPANVRNQALAYLDSDADRTLSVALSTAQAAGVKADVVKVESRHPHEAIIATAKSKGRPSDRDGFAREERRQVPAARERN